MQHQRARVEPVSVAALRRRHPLQQVAAVAEYAQQRPRDRIDHQPALMGEEDDEEAALHQPQGEVAAQSPEMVA